ncbi:hypothetical protein AAVH_41044 [Aphelenchoides avenae]|nr:hypothetical protein AAVH_41044 [Aphelenchus avenae]
MHPATKAQLANNLTERLLPAPSPNPSLVRVVTSAFDSNPTTTPSNSSAGFHTASEGEASGGNAYGDYRAPAIVVPTAPTSGEECTLHRHKHLLTGTATPRSVDSMASLPPLPPSPPKIREQKT